MSNPTQSAVAAVAANTPKPSPIDELEALRAEKARLEAENAKLRASKAQSGKLSLRVSAKKALSVYGLGRWPVTLYRGQWERLIAEIPAIQAFVLAHASELSSEKGDS